MPYLLAVDSGNTLIKWGLHDGCSWLLQGKVTHADITSLAQTWNKLPEPSTIIVSHVADTLIKQKLSELLSIWTPKLQWITAVPYQCGVHNGYSNSSQLGCDRWAALIAAWNLQAQACLVIDIGTAMTVDALSDSGDFLGGIILPGPSLMLKLLEANTALPISGVGVFENFPLSTGNAIYSGVVQSLVGAIERMQGLLFATLRHSTASCIISGGGASSLISHINIPVKVVENLVLEGLAIIAFDSPKNKSLY